MKELLIKYLNPDKFIDGLIVDGKDTYTLFFGENKFEVNRNIDFDIYNKVNSKLREYHFYFVSSDKQYLFTLPDYFIEAGKRLAYKLAFTEIVTGKESDWNELLNVV